MRFYGKMTDGKPKINSGEAYKAFFEDLNDGEEFEIKITLTKDIRSLQMNSLYWVWLDQLSEHSGYTRRELHNYFKQELLCIEHSINGEEILDCPSTADLTIKEFSEYLKGVIRLSSQNFSFVLLDPEDRLR